MTKTIGFGRAFALFGIIWAVFAAIWLLAGKLALTGHEVDVMHATDAAMRMVEGQKPHLDFLTPLGILAFLPIAGFLSAGFGADQALIYSNLLIPLMFLPAIAYLAASRMSFAVGLLFGLFCIALGVAGVYGGTASNVSMSLYYNRWCWMVAFILVAAIMLDPKTERPVIDGIIIGLCLSFLALVKMSYFVSFAPAVLVAMLSDRNSKQIATIAVTGACAVVAATVLGGGISYWAAYASDLNFVRLSEIRPKPGSSFTFVLSGPKFLSATIILLIAVISLRQTKRMRAGLLLMVLVPGFAFVTYQNWGNDPKWLLIIAVLCFIWAAQSGEDRAFGTSAHTLFFSLGLAAAVLASPSFFNVLNSPLRNYSAKTNDFAPMLQGEVHNGLRILRASSFNPKGSVELAATPDPFPASKSDKKPKQDPLIVGGVELTQCELKSGYFGKTLAIAEDLKASGFGDATIGYAAAFNPLPLVGGFNREPNRPVWYYGGTRGIADADYIVAPTCPVKYNTFRHYIKTLQEAGVTMTLAHETPHYRLFQPAKPGG